MEIFELESEVQLQNLLSKNPQRLYVIDCYADWCGPCKVLGANLEAFSKTTS